MDEHAAFETRAVLAPRRARLSRVVLALPVLALVGIAWAGGSARHQSAALPGPSIPAAVPSPSAAVTAVPVPLAPQYPDEVLGFDVQRLGDVRLATLTRDDVIAIAGWYVPLATTACPAVVESLPGLSFPQPHPGYDPWAYCDRSGVLYDARTGLEQRHGDGPASVNATLVQGVRMPAGLRQVGADPMPIVVLGHFVETSTACMLLGACPSELIVDHLAWSPSS